MFKSLFRRSAVMAVEALFLLFSVQAQQNDTTREDAIRVFIDCSACDMNYIKEELPYINYVRDVKEAQVYLLVTRQTSGSGGAVQTLFFTGQENFAGMKDTLTYASRPDMTIAISREGLTKTIAAGLMRYVAKTPIISQVQISFMKGPGAPAPPPQAIDKWRNWVFELSTTPRFSMEKSLETFSWTNGIEGNHVTPEWKIQNTFSHSFNSTTYIRDKKDSVGNVIGETRSEVIKKSWSFNQLTVKSLSDHWSTGLRANADMSTVNNYDLKISLTPSIEYDLFPYSESTRRQLRVLYGIGYVYADYIDSTLYNKVNENLIQETLDIALQIQQAWGSANVSVGASNYMHDFSKYNVQVDAIVRLRILKGLSLNINGSVGFPHDQLNLAKGDISDVNLYLRTRALETTYSYEGSLGITYTFGSIYSNVVNPRFGGGGGFGGSGGGGGFSR